MIDAGLKLKPGSGFHLYGHAYKYPRVCNGMQELRRGIQTELIAAVEGGSKQATAHQFKIDAKLLKAHQVC